VAYSLKIALRYLTSNWAQTALLVLGVGVGVFIFVFISALIGGLGLLLIDRTAGNIAHVTVEAAGNDPVSLYPRAPGDLVAILKSNDRREQVQAADAYLPVIAALPQVKALAAEILGNGFLVKGETTQPVQVTGIEPEQVSTIADIAGNLTSGAVALNTGTILIGGGLANSMGLAVGQTVLLRTDRNTEQSFIVGGIFTLGVAALDDASAFIAIRSAGRLFELQGGVSRIEVKIGDLNLAPQVALQIAARTGLKATPWTEKNKQLLDGLVAQANSGNLIKGFALVTIVIGVASALLLATYRRASEIGIMRAMGASRRFVILIFVIQGAVIGLSGGLFGSLVAYLTMLPFPLPEQTRGVGFPIDIRQGDFGTAILLTLVGALLASIWPARSAARVDPVSVIG
jgi:lipoprotein-releasing system permease protein